MSQIKLLFAMALLVAITLLTVFSPPDLSTLPPMMLVVIALFIGALISAIIGIGENWQLHKNIKKKDKEIQESGEKIKNLRQEVKELEDKIEKSESEPEKELET